MKQLPTKQLASTFLLHQTQAEMENFLIGILTPKEILELTTRLSIISLLKAGMPQREIAEKLGVGIATVTRGSKELQLGRFSYVSSQ